MQERIRVLHVAETLKQSGAGSQAALLASQLPVAEFESRLAVTRDRPRRCAPLPRSHVAVDRLGQRNRWSAAISLLRQVHRVRPHLLHGWDTDALPLLPCRLWGVPAIVSSDQHVASWPHRGARRWETNPGRRLWGQASMRCDVRCPPGIAAPGTDRHRVARWLRTQLQLPQRCQLVATVGALAPHKRMKDMIWALALLSEIRDDIHLLVFGEGSLHWRLQKFSQQAGVATRVHFFGYRDDVTQILPGVDCCWQVSDRCSLGLAVIEAMRAGVPVVVSDIDGHRRIVDHERTGLVVTLGDRAALARATNRLLQDAQRWQRLASAGKRQAEQAYSIDRMVRHYVALYRNLLSQSV